MEDTNILPNIFLQDHFIQTDGSYMLQSIRCQDIKVLTKH